MPRVDLLATRSRTTARTTLAVAAIAAVAAGLVIVLSSSVWRGMVVPPERPASAVVLEEVSPGPSEVAALRVRPLPEWLDAIASEAGMGLVVAPDVDAEVAAAFPPGTTWESRLKALARIGAFTYRVDSEMIEVWVPPVELRSDAESLPAPNSPLAPSNSAAPVELDEALPESGAGPADCSGDPPVPPIRPIARVARLVNARAVEVAPVLYDTIGDAEMRVAADASSNTLVLSGPPDQVSAMERIARALDLPKRSFLLEAQIVEVKRSSRDERGVEWLFESGDVGGLVDFPAADTRGEQSGVIVATSGSHSLRAKISALAASGRARVVSRPRVIVVEGKPASIESVRVLRVRVPERGAVVADGDDISVSSDGRAVEEIPVGISLVVEPAMQGQGRIVLRIRAESSTLGPPLPPDDIPEELSRVVDAEIVLGDGETAVLGGLRREARSSSGAGVPVLRSIPILGLLFGKRRDEHDGEELVVLVTPRVLE